MREGSGTPKTQQKQNNKCKFKKSIKKCRHIEKSIYSSKLLINPVRGAAEYFGISPPVGDPPFLGLAQAVGRAQAQGQAGQAKDLGSI